MTNREWINSLSDDDFIKWLFSSEELKPDYPWRDNIIGDCLQQPSPRLKTLKLSSMDIFKKWLKEERKR